MKWLEELRNTTSAEIHTDEIHRSIYSVDASIYEVKPLAIFIPKTKEDLLILLRAAAKENTPVIARGAATGITGGCIGEGVIVDLSKYLNRILEINIQEGYAICEPGVVQDHLNEALKPHGYRLGPDTSTGNRATIGGMFANNAAGARSLKYGCMIDHVLEVEIALAGGVLKRFGLTTEEQWKSDFGALDSIRAMRDEIKARFPTIPRHVSGYNLDRIIGPFPINLSQLFVGSEGTLGIATEIKVSLSPLLNQTTIGALFFNDMRSAMEQVPKILEIKPVSLEMIDDKVVEMARTSPSVKDKCGWIEGNPKAILLIESEGEAIGKVIDNPQHVWDVRKAGLGLLLSKRSYSRAIAFIEDISIAPEKLSSFIPQFFDYLRSKGKDAGIYGHVGSGCLHIRPYIDLRSEDERQLMQEIQDHVATMILDVGGAMSGEHGDGLVRSWLNEKMYGPRIMQAFLKVKRHFDPDNLMNPNKIVEAPPLLDHLRTRGKAEPIRTFLDFGKEGGFELAVDLCNGNGMCRKSDGLMCPSYHATKDEYDSTRARAQTLRQFITGRLPKEQMTSDAVMDVLDLCIECKGCKKECPSQVDMAKIKSEILYQRGNFSLRSRLFAHIGKLQYFASFAPRLANFFGSQKWFKKILGVASERDLPHISEQRFSKWFAMYQQPKLEKCVSLFNDTFTEFNHPEIGRAAVRVLNRLGYRVNLIPWKCCGRPMISKGLLKEARQNAVKVAKELDARSEPILVLEPSCHSALIDDYRGLIGKTLNVELFDQFIQKEELPLKYPSPKILVHGHCHQKSLASIPLHPQLDMTLIDSSCCGMAGSFGYEEEHYEISMKMGALKLFKAVDEAESETWIVASGVSCTNQIKQGTSRTPLHYAVMLEKLLC